MEKSIGCVILTVALGYLLIIVSTIVLATLIWLITGYYPSFTFFTLALMTFRLVEVHQAFLVAPLIVGIAIMMLLNKTAIDSKIAAGLSTASYYLSIALIYMATGASELPIEILLPWILWAFILGFASSIILDRLHS